MLRVLVHGAAEVQIRSLDLRQNGCYCIQGRLLIDFQALDFMLVEEEGLSVASTEGVFIVLSGLAADADQVLLVVWDIAASFAHLVERLANRMGVRLVLEGRGAGTFLRSCAN